MGRGLQGHDHALSVVVDRDGLECDACDRAYRDGYFCAKCKFTVHKKCAFVFNTRETLFELPSHVGHPLKLLATGAPDHTDPKCHICGKNTKRLLYHCSTCNLNLNIDCMVDAMCGQAHLNMWWHHHPLLMVDFNGCLQCDCCGLRSGNGYFCPRCRLMIHERCANVFDLEEVTRSSHAKHSLKRLKDGAPHYTKPECHICGNQTGKILYHCDICKFNLDFHCAITKPPPITLSNLKVHEHTLTLMPRLISFACDACGKKGDRAPYVCLHCDFLIHRDCADLPHVIHVNRHDHRVSYTYPLGPGEWKCGVCLEEIDWSYGAYSCSTCPSYALHSRCATRRDVWDGKELERVPERFEDIMPFKRNKDNTITHFAHDHNMSLHKDDNALEESVLCRACFRPIGSDAFYNCSDCGFILHETCANLPKKKRHFLGPRRLTLRPIRYNSKEQCDACLQRCCKGGFMYTDEFSSFDLICTSITVPFLHGSHPHPLLYFKPEHGQFKTCQNCGDESRHVLGCGKCNYFLDFRCATLPITVRLRRYDDHPLTLCYGEKANGKYWCDICERETNPKTWFYTCKECGVALHISCVIGDVRYPKPGGKIQEDVELLPNNTSSRPLCRNCHCRCPGPFILKDHDNGFLCSFYCFRRSESQRCLLGQYSSTKVICPPWALEANS